MEMSPQKSIRELQAFLGIINYLGKFSPSKTDTSKLLRKLITVKTEWTRNATYQKLFEKAKLILTDDACMKFYDETQPLYPETDASRIRLRAGLLQTRSSTSCPRDKAPDNSTLRPMTFASKSLSSA